MTSLGIIMWIERDPALYGSIVVTGLVSTVAHELGHVFAAIRQGDETPRLLGHVTLNPLVHMGGFGIVALLVAGLAFGATPVNPGNFRGRHGRAAVSFSGPAVNLVLGWIGLTALAFLRVPDVRILDLPNGPRFLAIFGVWNWVLLLFNMLPLPPLDGSSVVANFSPGYARWIHDPAHQPFILGGFLLLFFFSGAVIVPFAMDVAGAYVGLLRG